MRRPQLVGALVAAVIALVASAVVAVVALGGTSRGPTMMSGQSQRVRSGVTGGSEIGGSGIGGSMMGEPGMGGSMMGSTGGMGISWLPGDGVAVSSIPAARARAATAATPEGLHPGEVMWFDNGFYVELKDAAGKPATEVIVDPRTGAVTTEPGPAMMWNTRTGMHQRARGANAGTATSDTTQAQARSIGTSWLAANKPGTTIGSIAAYPGYFTLDLRRGGVVSGMMSVNSTSGAVWYHTWHGTFIAMQDS